MWTSNFTLRLLPNACTPNKTFHYSAVMINAMASQITGVSIVCSAVCSGADQGKYHGSASLAFVREIHQFPFDDVIMHRNK